MKRKWLLLAFLLTFTLPAAALCAPELLEALWWRFGSDPAVSVLRGEYWGRIICGVLLTAMPFVPLACFLLERAALRRARRRRESVKPPEFATAEERRAFYLRQLEEEDPQLHVSWNEDRLPRPVRPGGAGVWLRGSGNPAEREY